MKKFLTITIFLFPCLLIGQLPDKFNTPDTLWVYGPSTDSEYGLSPEKPIKVGGVLPIHIYRYLNNLTDTNGLKIYYERIGSTGSKVIKRDKPLTTFSIHDGKREFQIYFDQYEWDYPKVLKGFSWDEKRTGYHGEFKNDTILRAVEFT